MSKVLDDIVFLWSGSKEDSLPFVSSLNDNMLIIALTSNISEMSVDFLDLTLNLQDGQITTTLFCKPTDGYHPYYL